MKRVLVIGGSDSGAGAGVQADLKTLHVLGVHASTVLTAVTAQSTVAVGDVHQVPIAVLQAQLDAVLQDIGADVVKTGMLPSAEAISTVAASVGTLPLVVDPVGTSSTGDSLAEPGALRQLLEVLLPLALVVTPNLTEVAALTGLDVVDDRGLLEGAKAIHALGPQWVLVTGGHLQGDPVDLLYDGRTATRLRGRRIDSPHTHGTGCTLASALAGYLALGRPVPEAARLAKDFVTAAITAGYPLGNGAGPVRQVTPPD